MNFLFKDFLSFEEVGEYLAGHGYYYNLDNEYDHNRLRSLIVDLHHERKLMPVFFYSGWGVVKVVDRKDLEIIDSREVYLKDYFCVVEIAEILRKLLKDGKPIDIKQYNCFYYSTNDIARLLVHGDDIDSNIEPTSLTTVEFEAGKPSHFITIDDLRYSKRVFYQLFNEQLEVSRSEVQEVQAQPNDAYITPAIEIMNKVIAEFWIDYDPSQPAPKQSTITKWITDNFDGVSDALALNIDKVCRHSDAKSGGQYKR